MNKLEELIEQIKEQIDPLFDDEEGRGLLSDLSVYISSNLNEIPT